MIIHLFTQVSDYSNEFLSMLLKKFDPSNHIIVFRTKPGLISSVADNKLKIYYLISRRELISEMPLLLKNADKLIFHSFPVSRSLFYWIRHKNFMNKAVWSVWGQDAYWYKYCRKNITNIIYEKIRKMLIKKLGTIFCPIRGDYEYIRLHYKTNASYISGMYPIPTDFEMLKTLKVKNKHDGFINIQIGNSANPTNNTEEVIRFLSRHAKDNYRVFCPLSYGDRNYAQKVIKTGQRELGEKFIPLTAFLSRFEYADFISSIDVLIMNHQRQQGLGNIFSYLFLGKKVYIRRDNSSYSFFEDNDIKVFDTTALLDSGNIDELMDMDLVISERNRNITESIVSMDKITAGWEKILT